MAPWWQSAVVYQIYPRSFADSDGDGIGDLRGIAAHLDHLGALGVDVVWLSPVYRSPMDDNGYDISDYTDIDPLFGTLDDIDTLIEGLHARGMKLVMDLVVNHTSDEHAWFAESRDLASPMRDWYIWRPARAGHEPGTPGAEPTNAGSFFSGPGWQFDPASGQYYLHLFSPKQPDLNWENPAVRRAVYDMMRWWVDRGVDGFRMDVINLISKTYPLADGPANGPGGLCYDPSIVVEGPRLHEFLREMNREVGLSAKELFSVGEMIGVDAETARSHTDPAAGELGMVFTFEHVSIDNGPTGVKWDVVPLHLPALKANLAEWQEALADVGWNSLYFENHDQPRSVSRFGDDSAEFRVVSAKTLATTLHLLKGTPYVYQGQELGMTNAGFTSIEQYNDLESTRFFAEAVAGGGDPAQLLGAIGFKSRDNARTPMQWDASANAGFSTGTPWLAVNPNHTRINAAAAVADPDSVFHHYRRLIALRHELEVVRQGRFALLLPEDERLFCYTRTLGEEVLLVVANWSSAPVVLPSGLPDRAGAEVLLGTHDSLSDELAAWESRIYRLA
ncbi:glycoside hydrolase family 13 protein [Propionicimonas sp.]|uniref:glycoside hydrolase family 13 protein n=1 Tax=Propionicimonas sp. TaxID=1955623 RepID=UPI0039E5EA3B